MDTKYFNSDADSDLIDRMLRFANMTEIKSAREVEAIFEDHPYAFLFPHIPDPSDIQSLVQLRDDLRGWLRIFAAGHSQDSMKVRDEMVLRYQKKATRTATIRYKTLDGKQRARKIDLWGLPRLDFVRGQLTIGVRPFLSGAESAVYFGIVMLFASQRTDKSAICQAPLPNQKRVFPKRQCGKFFLETKERRAACSEACRKLRQRDQVSRSVTKFISDKKEREEQAKQKRAQPKRRNRK
jgi:hypothetical protein